MGSDVNANVVYGESDERTGVTEQGERRIILKTNLTVSSKGIFEQVQ